MNCVDFDGKTISHWRVIELPNGRVDKHFRTQRNYTQRNKSLTSTEWGCTIN